MEGINSAKFKKYFTTEFFYGRFIDQTNLEESKLQDLSKFLNWISIQFYNRFQRCQYVSYMTWWSLSQETLSKKQNKI